MVESAKDYKIQPLAAPSDWSKLPAGGPSDEDVKKLMAERTKNMPLFNPQGGAFVALTPQQRDGSIFT